MLGGLLRYFVGTANERYIKKLDPIVAQINAQEEGLSGLSDDEIRAKTDEFRERLEKGETVDDLLVEAFAVVREAAKRTLGQRHFDVQMKGGIILHRGHISEMKTGEGKTLVATLPVYLNAIAGKGAHVVTVNDYLASRDSEWMGRIYRFLGLSVGCIVHGLSDDQRKEAYAADVTYGTNNEFGFDYLRDNMKFRLDEMVQRAFNFAIVDEVDSILIDEARTPLIISGPAEDSSERYIAVDRIIPKLKPVDFDKDEKQRSITLTEDGMEHVEELLEDAGLLNGGGLYDVQNIALVHHVDQALRAHHMFQRDVDYIVKDGKIVIIDEFTGRMMEGRRFAEGLHQALEAREGVSIQSENQTLASITFQNYFRMYPKLAGMTGTAMTEAPEFMDIYGLGSYEIPTNVPVARKDHHDEIYRTLKEKHTAILDLIKDCHKRKQPVLVGTTSIEKSEQLATLLKTKTKIPFSVLNARHHEKEAFIVSQAGVPGAVTIATNMAGRGTDIQLGGNLQMRLAQELEGIDDPKKVKEITDRVTKEVEEGKEIALKAGGLYVLATERHESRRIDNQLRGRSGRQGDPGASKFFLSLEDDLMRIFGSERMDTMLRRLGLKEGEAIFHPWISKALEKAQQKVEARNFDIRKNLLKYDDVMNDQRKVVYEQRKEIMDVEDVSETAAGMRHEMVEEVLDRAMPYKSMPDQWDLTGLKEDCRRILALDLPIDRWAFEEGADRESLTEKIREASDEKMAKKAADYGPDLLRVVEKSMLLQMLDQTWKEHLLALDHLRHTILLRAYGQKDPLNEYKREAFTMFEEMLDMVREKTTTILSHVEIRMEEPPEDLLHLGHGPAQMREVHERPDQMVGEDSEKSAAHIPFQHALAEEFDPSDPTTWGKVGRNAPCPCGSGDKFKHCHGKL